MTRKGETNKLLSVRWDHGKRGQYVLLQTTSKKKKMKEKMDRKERVREGRDRVQRRCFRRWR